MLSAKALLMLWPLGVFCIPQYPEAQPNPQLTPNKNLRVKCTPYHDGKTCSFGIEMNYLATTGPRWSAAYVYDWTCALLGDVDLHDTTQAAGINVTGKGFPTPLTINKWDAGQPGINLGKNYVYHLEFEYLDKVTASDLTDGVRQGKGGNMCNCYAGNANLIGGGACERDLCCGCAFDCAKPKASKAYYGEIEIHPTGRPAGYWGETEPKPSVHHYGPYSTLGSAPGR